MTRATLAAKLLAAAVASSATVADAPGEFPPGSGQSEVQAACGMVLPEILQELK